mmetsp:Transcript_10743/g.22260  ORF Transcript_10743/g.22260 Transcript_10743/m.22260 type:complete len:209 (-) Transcript_10743:996-1622(-)
MPGKASHVASPRAEFRVTSNSPSNASGKVIPPCVQGFTSSLSLSAATVSASSAASVESEVEAEAWPSFLSLCESKPASPLPFSTALGPSSLPFSLRCCCCCWRSLGAEPFVAISLISCGVLLLSMRFVSVSSNFSSEMSFFWSEFTTAFKMARFTMSSPIAAPATAARLGGISNVSFRGKIIKFGRSSVMSLERNDCTTGMRMSCARL